MKVITRLFHDILEKAVFQCLEDENGEYEELPDDFLFLANEGKPALEMVTTE